MSLEQPYNPPMSKASDSQRVRVLFVCMGNICRSPLAEGLFLHKINQRGVAGRFSVESAGTGGWHAGELPDPRVRAVAQSRGVELCSRARQVTTGDFAAFDHIICMDEDNREHVLEMGAPPDKVRLLLECHAEAPMREVPDPYYGGADGFELVYKLVDEACEALVDELLAGRR
jgi:protein-tyrosine phosphatase